MKAELKRLHSPDVKCLETHVPARPECFGIFVQAMVGLVGQEGEESFDFTLCTPSWFASLESATVMGQYHLIVQKYDYAVVDAFVRDFCAKCEGETWDEVARRVGALGRWEFADYVP